MGRNVYLCFRILKATLMTRYYIVAKVEGIDYILHSNNKLYWNVWYNGKRVFPLTYKSEKRALNRIAKVKHLYPDYNLKVRTNQDKEFFYQED